MAMGSRYGARRIRRIRQGPEEGQPVQQRILALLAKRGFRLLKREVQVPSEGLRHGPRFDFLLGRGGRKFAVEVKAARGFADWFFHWLARPILVLQAVQRLHGWEPLLGVYVDHLEPQAVRRFRAQAHVYAPDLWWILADAEGSVVSHLPDRDEEDIRASLKEEEIRSGNRAGIISSEPGIISGGSRSYGPGRAAPRLSFGDLDQWLIKVLVFAPSQAKFWGGPGGRVRNILQLAKLAKVSPPLVYRWAAAMEAAGYLEKRSGMPPVLRNADALLAHWRGRYRVEDNELIPCKPIFAQRVDEQYVEEVLGLLRAMQGRGAGYALSGHQACRFFRVRHSAARSLHLHVRQNPASLMQALQVAPDSAPSAPIVLIRPAFGRSVFWGAAQVDGVVVCDALQVYLDLYHLRDRGREQADFVYDQLLEPLLRAAAEAKHVF